jgi:hypothetical protein
MELRKVVPAPDNYQIERAFQNNKKTKLKCLFGASYD